MTKTGNSERTTIPAKERTAKDHAKAVGNGGGGAIGGRDNGWYRSSCRS
jgi:hypothetical protein